MDTLVSLTHTRVIICYQGMFTSLVSVQPYNYNVLITVSSTGVYTAECKCYAADCKPWPTATGTINGSTLSMFAKIPGAISNNFNLITFSNGVTWERLVNGTGVATIKLTGPSDVWFGVGFGSTGGHTGGESTGLSMATTPYTIVVLGNGSIQERT